MIGLTTINHVKITRFVCEDCGFSEEWIEEKDGIQRLKDKYK